MTSPVQLKYLNAMGIPVWVSRDLIIENNLSLNNVTVNTEVTLPHNESGHSPDANEKQSNNSAKSILDSLESNSSKNETDIQNKNLKTNIISDAVDASVKTSNISSDNYPIATTTTSIAAASAALYSENLLFQSSHNYVYASGCKNPEWMVIGHSPESFNGVGQEPFAGEAGELLNNMLRAVGIQQPRLDTYLLNVVDKHQPNDGDEQIHIEIQQKLKQKIHAVIDDIQPKIILLVGQIAAQNLLDCQDPLIIMRSKVHTLINKDIPCVVTYYPSYLLQKPIDKRKAWNDLKLAMSLLSKKNPKT